MPADAALFAAATPGEWTADDCWVETVEHPHVIVAECHDYDDTGEFYGNLNIACGCPAGANFKPRAESTDAD